MVKRNKIGLGERIRGLLSNTPNDFGAVSLQQELIDRINQVKIDAEREALKKYDASKFKKPTVEVSDITYVAPIEKPIEGSTPKHTKYVGNQNKFVNEIYDSYYKAVRPKASSDADAKRQAKFLTQKAHF